VIDLTPIFHAIRQATALGRAVQREHIVRSEKSGREPVTIADYGSQAILCRALQEYFPDDAVMSEESGRQFMSLVAPEQRALIVDLIEQVTGIRTDEDEVAGWLDHGKAGETQRLWVIDPIDGTKGFLAGRHYVHAVGILQERQPVGGVIAAPAYPGSSRLFYALDGQAFHLPLDAEGEPTPIRVSNRADPSLLRALESADKGHASHERMAQVRAAAGMLPAMVERADSMEKYARIAAGDAELYLRLPRLYSTRPHSIWDHAAGTALVEAAGGRVSDVDGSPLDFSTGTALRNIGVVATNGPIHDRVIAAIQEVLSKEAARDTSSD
jgi:HAL2 family 3'(2'),5'-bisphosphate nucleotidase